MNLDYFCLGLAFSGKGWKFAELTAPGTRDIENLAILMHICRIIIPYLGCLAKKAQLGMSHIKYFSIHQ